MGIDQIFRVPAPTQSSDALHILVFFILNCRKEDIILFFTCNFFRKMFLGSCAIIHPNRDKNKKEKNDKFDVYARKLTPNSGIGIEDYSC